MDIFEVLVLDNGNRFDIDTRNFDNFIPFSIKNKGKFANVVYSKTD